MGRWNRREIGDTNGCITIIACDPAGTSKRPRYFVRCTCGKEYSISSNTFGTAKSCRDCCRKGQPRKYGDRVIGEARIYHAWIQMRRRCNPEVEPEKNKNWAHRGIRVCKEWDESFEVFEKWSLENGFRPGLSLDRYPDHDGNYEPTNCQWVTKSVNSSRARAQYRYVRTKFFRSFYDEPTFGDF